MLIFSCTSRLESRYIHYPISKSDVFHISCPRACTSQYHPLGWYWLAGWLVQALGHVLWNTHSGVRCTCSVKTKSALENFLDKVRGTETVKTMYMAFRNWIMSNTKERRFSSTNSQHCRAGCPNVVVSRITAKVKIMQFLIYNLCIKSLVYVGLCRFNLPAFLWGCQTYPIILYGLAKTQILNDR